jgi:hypothetical protein
LKKPDTRTAPSKIDSSGWNDISHLRHEHEAPEDPLAGQHLIDPNLASFGALNVLKTSFKGIKLSNYFFWLKILDDPGNNNARVDTPGFANPKNSLGKRGTTTEISENSYSQAVSALGDNGLHSQKIIVSRIDLKHQTVQNLDESERRRKETLTPEVQRSNSMESIGSQRRSVRKSQRQIDNFQERGSPDDSPSHNKKYGAVRGKGNVVSIRATSQRYLSGEDSSAFTNNDEPSRDNIPSILGFNRQTSLNNIDPSPRAPSIECATFEYATFDSPGSNNGQTNLTTQEKKISVKFFLVKK